VTLVELMIAIAIGLVLLAAMAALFAANSQTRIRIDESARQIENGRYALEMLRDDIHLAGYYGSYNPTAPVYTLATPCTTTMANTGWNSTGPTLPPPLSGFSQGDTLPSGCSSYLSHLKANTDVLVVSRFNTNSVTATVASASYPNDFFIQSSLCATEIAPQFIFNTGNAGSGTYSFHKKDCTTAAELNKYEVHVYYVGTCSVCTGGNADTTPTLRRLMLSGASISDEPLVEGIDSMRIDYMRDTDGDKVPDTLSKCSTDTASGNACTAAQFAQTLAVRVYILARNIDSTAAYSDTKSYTMGLSGSVSPTSDTTLASAYQRHLYSGQYAAFNVAGRTE
jgi:type IV pilus assembly protein PilW